MLGISRNDAGSDAILTKDIMAEEQRSDDWDDLKMDVDKLSDQQLEDLAQLVTRKLRESMRQDLDRSGRF